CPGRPCLPLRPDGWRGAGRRPGSRHSHHTDQPDHAAAGSHLPGPAHPRPRCAPCGRHLSPLTTRLTLEEVHMRNNLFKLTAAAGVLALTLTACGSEDRKSVV